MRRALSGWFRGVICILLGALVPYTLSAQIIVDPTIGLAATSSQFLGPVVNSFARAILYNSDGSRAYIPLIIGHEVKDLNTNTTIYSARVSVEEGYANSRARDLPGTINHCYGALMGVHVNSENIHESYASPVDCLEPPEERPVIEVPDENCPILLDLRQNGFHLSGTEAPVSFDIDADGVQDQIAWTKAGEDDAFLCWDRNQNGVIDDGRELFGFATLLLSGEPARVGYRALAELDGAELGGNGDGKIDASDRSFGNLCAWVDTNRDGESQSSEIRELALVGIVALEYRYETIRLRDSYGNLFRYVSRAQMRTSSGGIRSWLTYDVIFAEP